VVYKDSRICSFSCPHLSPYPVTDSGAPSPSFPFSACFSNSPPLASLPLIILLTSPVEHPESLLCCAARFWIAFGFPPSVSSPAGLPPPPVHPNWPPRPFRLVSWPAKTSEALCDPLLFKPPNRRYPILPMVLSAVIPVRCSVHLHCLTTHFPMRVPWV